MKLLKKFAKPFLLLMGFISLQNFGADRSQTVHSRLVSSLSGFLSPSEFLVIVKKAEDLLEAGSESQAVGIVRSLPGLTVSVDSRGELVKQDGVENSYTGPLDISVVIDVGVKEETYQTVQKLVPEIMGTLNEADSIKVSKALLKQPPPVINTPPQVVVQNNLGTTDKDLQAQEAARKDLMRMLAIALGGMGFLLWINGRRRKNDNINEQKGRTETAQSSKNMNDEMVSKNTIEKEAQVKEVLGSFSGETVSFYLLKLFKEDRKDFLFSTSQWTSLNFQKTLLLSLPGWLSQYFLKTWNSLAEEFKENPPELVSPEVVIRELAIFEKEMSSPSRKNRILIETFPAEALSGFESKLANLPQKVVMELWNQRPDTAKYLDLSQVDLSKNDEATTDDMGAEIVFEALWQLDADAVVRRARISPVQKWSGFINKMATFAEVEKQLQKAKEVLATQDFNLVFEKCYHFGTFSKLTTDETRAFLRDVDAADLAWLYDNFTVKPEWNLESLLRPIRLAMIKDALSQKSHLSWNESDIKEASTRVMALLKETRDNEKTQKAAA
jgi:hypothetical protein